MSLAEFNGLLQKAEVQLCNADFVSAACMNTFLLNSRLSLSANLLDRVAGFWHFPCDVRLHVLIIWISLSLCVSISILDHVRLAMNFESTDFCRDVMVGNHDILK